MILSAWSYALCRMHVLSVLCNGVTRLDGLVGDNVGLTTALMKCLNALIDLLSYPSLVIPCLSTYLAS